MQAFKNFTGQVLPLDRPNVDTDAIIPKQYLKSIKRSGFGPNLFDDWRYLDAGMPGQDHYKRAVNAEFIMNQAEYKSADILLARENFGCGSSREHAVWALTDYGFKVVIAPSFGDIFYNNSFKNGFLPIRLTEDEVQTLFSVAFENKEYALSVNLETQTVSDAQGNSFSFEIDAGLKERLLKGLDDIGITLGFADDIKAYEASQAKETPWLFANR